jgi:transitional endoplasmic reticulum ATPase
VCVFCDVERMAKFVFENDPEALSKTLNDIRVLERNKGATSEGRSMAHKLLEKLSAMEPVQPQPEPPPILPKQSVSETSKGNDMVKAPPPPAVLAAAKILLASEAQETKFKDVTFTRGDTNQIILPPNMSIEEGIVWFKRQQEKEETKVKVSHTFDSYPIEGAYGLLCVLQKLYGFVDVQAQIVQGMFGPEERPATFHSVEIEPGKTIQVPWGRFELPNIAGYLQAGFHIQPDKTVKFKLDGEIKRKSEETVNDIVMALKKWCKENSIFKGRAITVTFPDAKDNDNAFSIQPGYLPRIMDVSKVKVEELIFPKEVQDLVKTALFTPIEHTARCRAQGIPLKRGVLLEGPFGVGKTLTAYVTAKKCVDNGWTFLYTKKASDLDRAIAMARQYQPAAIFVEDIDRAVEGNVRTEEIDDILNVLDGVDSKDSEIMVVLTTNNVTGINQAMLRPGRIDTVVPVRAPDASAAQKLMRLYGRGLIKETEDLREAGIRLAGQIPATIREVVERAKLSAIGHTDGGETLYLTGNDLVTSVNGMMAQITLLSPHEEPEYGSKEERAAAILAKSITAFTVMLAGKVPGTHNHVDTDTASPALTAAGLTVRAGE